MGLAPRVLADRPPDALWGGGHRPTPEGEGVAGRQAGCLSRCPVRRAVPNSGSGGTPLAYPPGEARTAIATLHRYVEEAGRDPATIGIDTRVSAGAGCGWRDQVRFWASIGVTHLTLANYSENGHLHRIAGRSLSDRVAAMNGAGTQSLTGSNAAGAGKTRGSIVA